MSGLRKDHKKTKKQRAYMTWTADKQLTRKVLSAVTAVGFMANPLTALAGSITASNGTDYKADKNGVFNIYAQQYNGENNAVNQFQKFQLDAGKIANLYFHMEKTVGKPRTC